MAALLASPSPCESQVVPRDTTRTRRDSLALAVAAVDSLKPDTVKAPFARSESPVIPGIGEPYLWDREALFASGAFTLLDLLERVPGVTGFRSGSIASPMYAAVLGDASHVRVFLDGMEIAPLDARARGGGAVLLDLGEVQLWSLEEVRFERGADEIRVHMRSWRADRTTAYTRTDVMTGDLEQNIYRGFFAKRFQSGAGVQLGGQQYGYGQGGVGSVAAGGDELALMARVGWARGIWSVDGFATRANRTRDRQAREAGFTGNIPLLRATRTDMYVRAAAGDPERGAWAQVVAASLNFTERTPFAVSPKDSADTTRSEGQYVAAAGFTRWGIRLSATNRLHMRSGTARNVISGRAAYDGKLASVSIYAEEGGNKSTSSEEASLRLTPFSLLALSGAISRRHGGPRDTGDDAVAARAELGIRIFRTWAGGGVLSRDSVTLPALRIYDSTYVDAPGPRATGSFLSLRGYLWKDIGVDAFAVKWRDRRGGFYRPEIQSRAEVFIKTQWLRRFPTRNFGFLGSMAYEYRESAAFPELAPGNTAITAQRSTLSRALFSRVEIKILDAVLFWQQRYWLRPIIQPDIVPGFVLPTQFNIYGVRWTFWN